MQLLTQECVQVLAEHALLAAHAFVVWFADKLVLGCTRLSPAERELCACRRVVS